MEEKKTKEMFMLEKVEVLYNFEKGMRIAAVRSDYNENNTMILFIKKNEDKVRGNIMASVPSSVKISCLSTSALPQKLKRALCIWLEDEAQKGPSVSDAVVTEEAEQLNNHISPGVYRRAASMPVEGILQIGRIR